MRKFILTILLSLFVIHSAQAEDGVKNWYDGLFFKDTSYNFEFIRVLGSCIGGGADIGESIATARNIKQGDDESWYEEWKKTGDRLYGYAEENMKKGNLMSARQQYLRACNYYRSAGFYIHGRDKLQRALEVQEKSRECFRKFISGSKNIIPVRIPYGKTHLPGYYLTTDRGGKGKKPLLIIQTGFDGTKEELYFLAGIFAVRRGYNCLLFEGPGQGEVIDVQKIPFRPDWENVVTPVVDYALTLPGVDRERIALIGYSMGGYLAPRAVAFEHRIKACVADGGVYSFTDSVYRNLPPEMVRMIDEAPDEFNTFFIEGVSGNTTARWFMNNGMLVFGADSPADLYIKVRGYTMKGLTRRIKCNMLVINGESDDMMAVGQAKQLYDELECPKKYYLFTREQTAQAHCQMGAGFLSGEVIFDWLDEVLK